MITESYDAWLLSKRPSGDSSVYLTLFTKEKGRVTCLYKGGRTLKKRGVLQPFVKLWVACHQHKNYHYVQSVESLDNPLFLEKTALFSGLYLNELIHHALKPQDAHPTLFDCYVYTLQGLSIVTEPLAREALLRQFEWTLLACCGHGLTLEDKVSSHYQYKQGRGLIASSQGIVLEEAKAIVAGRFDEVKVLKSAKLVMRQAIDYLLAGQSLTSRKLFTFGHE